MYINIHVTGRGALRDQHLEGLGQIVVVCGKNNSGKTTLLYGVRDGAKYLKPSQVKIEEFYECVRRRGGSIYEDSGRFFATIPRYKDAWFETDSEEFTRIATDEFRKFGFMGSNPPEIHPQEVRRKYEKQFIDSKVVYISPKRILELNDSIETGRRVSPEGRGLLNFLFNASNQYEGTTERNIVDEIRNLLLLVSGGYEFIITTQEQNNLKLSFRKGTSNWINAEDCGLGLQDLLVILYFVVSPDHDVLLIEEPESHLHPEMQRKLLHACKEKRKKQFFFSTHSSVFLDLTLVDTILHTEMSEDGITISNDTRRAALLDSLGYSVTDNLVSDLIILVEGPSDKPVLEEFLRQMGLYTSHSIKIWPLGGDIMAKVDLSVFCEKYNIIALIDKDPGSSAVREKFKRKCAELGVPVHQLKKTAIENYFTVDALRVVFKGQISDELSEIRGDQTLDRQIGMNVKNNNDKIAKAMTLADIEGTDLLEFLRQVEQRLKN